MKADRQLSRTSDTSRPRGFVLMIMEDFDTDSLSSGKKVRFNANDEIFVIPSKWDRLSKKTGAGKEKFAKEPYDSKTKAVDDTERRRKSKQRSKKVKRSTKSTHTKTTATTRTFTSPSSQVLELESSVLSTDSKSSKTSSFEKKARKKAEPEIKLKLSHRNNKELSQDDIVLPRINYNSDLRKTIEHAVVRNRPSCESGFSKLHEQTRDNFGFSSLRPRLHYDSNSSTNSSILEEENNHTDKEECVLVLPERETKFSELSRNVDSWSPFSDGHGQLTESRTSRHKMPATLVIPNSILY